MLNKAYWDLILKVILYCVEEGSSSVPQSYTVASGADIKDLLCLLYIMYSRNVAIVTFC
jgi:hypothetical protein